MKRRIRDPKVRASAQERLARHHLYPVPDLEVKAAPVDPPNLVRLPQRTQPKGAA